MLGIVDRKLQYVWHLMCVLSDALLYRATFHIRKKGRQLLHTAPDSETYGVNLEGLWWMTSPPFFYGFDVVVFTFKVGVRRDAMCLLAQMDVI